MLAFRVARRPLRGRRVGLDPPRDRRLRPSRAHPRVGTGTSSSSEHPAPHPLKDRARLRALGATYARRPRRTPGGPLMREIVARHRGVDLASSASARPATPPLRPRRSTACSDDVHGRAADRHQRARSDPWSPTAWPRRSRTSDCRSRAAYHAFRYAFPDDVNPHLEGAGDPRAGAASVRVQRRADLWRRPSVPGVARGALREVMVRASAGDGDRAVRHGT